MIKYSNAQAEQNNTCEINMLETMQKIWKQLYLASCTELLKIWEFIAAPRRNEGLSE